jgi:hypothetical protein
MARRLAGVVAALLLALPLMGCAAPAPDPGEGTRPLGGATATLAVGKLRFALVLCAPPVSLLLLRAGPMFVWLTPNVSTHEVLIEDDVRGEPATSHLLQINDSGTVDYQTTLRWT